MAYTPNFTGDMLSQVIIDNLARIGYGLLGLSTIIALVLAYRWYKGRK